MSTNTRTVYRTKYNAHGIPEALQQKVTLYARYEYAKDTSKLQALLAFLLAMSSLVMVAYVITSL